MMLDAAPDATAILPMSVMQAIAIINEARGRGLSAPRDLSVAGYNDIPDAERSDPSLTFQASWWTVLQDRLLSGRAKSFPIRPSWAIPSMSALHCFQSQ
jgi:hypothetical protein